VTARNVTGSELFTVEQSHGKSRLIGPRPSDLGTVDTAAERSAERDALGRFQPGNQIAVGRGARKALRAPYRAAEQRIGEALATGSEPTVADVLLRDALHVFNAARAELGSRSVFAQGPTIAYAVETVLAGFFMREAAAAGFTTERGLELHERAMACETQAARAMTAALAAAKALGGRKAAHANAVIARIEREAERMLETQGEPAGDEAPT
jgi:hypothetical protein